MTRNRWFESTSLQQTVRLSREVARRSRERRLFARMCGPRETVRSAETRIGRRYGAYRRQCLCWAKFQYRSASDVSDGSAALAVRRSCDWVSRSREAEHRPLLVPCQWQTGVRQQLVRSQIARLAPVEDGLGDVRGEIAQADEPREIGWAHALALGECGKRRHAAVVDECLVEPARSDQQLDQPRIGFDCRKRVASL